MIRRKDRYGRNTRYSDKDNQCPNVLNCIHISFDCLWKDGSAVDGSVVIIRWWICPSWKRWHPSILVSMHWWHRWFSDPVPFCKSECLAVKGKLLLAGKGGLLLARPSTWIVAIVGVQGRVGLSFCRSLLSRSRAPFPIQLLVKHGLMMASVHLCIWANLPGDSLLVIWGVPFIRYRLCALLSILNELTTYR